MINLSSFIYFHVQRSPDRLAVVYDDQRLTYREFWDRLTATAGFLAAKGIGPGDVVAAFMKNSSSFLEIAFAVSHLGAVFLPINFRLAKAEAEYIAGNAGAKLLLADAEFQTTLAGMSPVVWVNEAAQKDSRRLAGGATHPVPSMALVQPDDLYRLMYTSGTTDRPKGVMHSYANFYWKSVDHVMTLGLGPDNRLLITGPLYHVGAFDLPGVAVLWMGGMMYIHRDYDPARVLASIAAERLNCAWLAPVMLSGLLGHAERDRHDVSSMRWIIGGGEKTPEGRIREFSKYFTQGRYIDAYGLTESCSGDTMMEAGREIEKIGSTGRPLAHVELEIRDPLGKVLPAGETGEICLRGPRITKGYWKDPAKTSASFFGDWFRTGDVGHVDAEGFLYLTDRKKDMIISGGENIASSEVERVIYQLPQVGECAVIGVADDKWGERPVAVVVLRPGQSLDYTALAAHCRDHLAGFKVPKNMVLRDALPRNPSGKILKRVLREELAKTGV